MDASVWLDWPRLLVWLIPALLVPAALLAWWLWRRHHAPRRELDRVLRRHALDALYDVIIPDGLDGHIHLDYLLLTRERLLVVDTLEVQGVVFGAPRMDEWAVMQGHRRHAFRNPLYALQDRVAAVKAMAPGVPVEGLAVFTRGAEFPKGVPEGTLTHADLAPVEQGVQAGETLQAAWQRIRDSLQREA